MLVGAQALSADPERDHRIALRGSGETLTYTELRTYAAQVAAVSAIWTASTSLQAGTTLPVIPRAVSQRAVSGNLVSDTNGLLVTPGVRETNGPGGEPFVALSGEWTPRFVAAFLGLASVGWAVGVLDPAAALSEQRAALAQLDPRIVIVKRSSADLVSALVRDGWGRAGSVDPDWILLARGDAPGEAPPQATPAGPFYVGFTSGSSGRPKAFVRSHRSWWESFQRFDDVCPIRTPGTVLVPGPLSSSHFLFGALHGLHIGATVELMSSSEYSPRQLSQRIADGEPPAAVFVVPTMLEQMARDGSAVDAAPERIFCAGAHLDATLRERVGKRFPTSSLVEYYGASELSFVAIHVDGDGTPPGSVGRAFPGVEISIRDDDDRELPRGETGVIFARSALTFMGYRGTPPESGARVLADGWVSVGDRGALDADGYLAVVGRGSSLIITGGANVQPEEVEAAVAACPGVAACVVVGVPDPKWGEVVCAAVVPAPGAVMERRVLRGQLAESLSRYKRPRRYVILAGPLPLGRTGKVDRERVRALVMDGTLTRELR